MSYSIEVKNLKMMLNFSFHKLIILSLNHCFVIRIFCAEERDEN